jgi:hypothetical protein
VASGSFVEVPLSSPRGDASSPVCDPPLLEPLDVPAPLDPLDAPAPLEPLLPPPPEPELVPTSSPVSPPVEPEEEEHPLYTAAPAATRVASAHAQRSRIPSRCKARLDRQSPKRDRDCK